MNEEQTRKEFEEWCVSHGFTLRPAETNCGIVIYGEYGNQRVQIAWQAWQASRQAMKPIKLPTKMKNTQSAECHCYNAAIEECKEAIKQAGHEVEE